MQNNKFIVQQSDLEKDLNKLKNINEKNVWKIHRLHLSLRLYLYKIINFLRNNLK